MNVIDTINFGEPPDPAAARVEAERRRLDQVPVADDGSRSCICGHTIKDGRGWHSHVKGHLNAAAKGKTYVPPKPSKPKKPKAETPTPEPEPEETATVEEACTALVALLTGRTTLDMEHVELVAGWIDHTRAVVAALSD